MPYQARTWEEIRERLLDRVEQKPFWTTQEALSAFNEGLYLWNLCTGRWRTRVTLTTVSGRTLYTLPSSILYRTRVEFNRYPLSPSTLQDLNDARYTWRTESTTTGGGVPTRPAVWVPISLLSFYIWPNDAAGGNTLTVDGIATTPVLVTDQDFLDLGDEHLDVLIGFALHVLTFKKGGRYFQATTDLFKAFLSAAAEENDQIKTSQTFRRVLGLDIRGFKPLRGEATQLDAIAGRQP